MLTTRFVTGSLTWTDVGTPDIDRANGFYGGVFGWASESAGEDFGGYVTYRSDGQSVAGGMQVPEADAPPAWSLYFRTPDIEATAKAVEQAGGTVVLEPVDVGELGRMAVFTDPTGAGFSAWQAGQMQGFEAVQRPGSLCWAELYTSDVAAASAFYSKALGLQTFEVPFPGGTYTTLYPEGTDAESMLGGVVSKEIDPLEAEGPSHWLPYFEVADCDAAAAKAGELGGSVGMPPKDLQDVGRIAKLTDPFGARFAVMRPAPRQGGEGES
ncbi:VOC family protein [Streptomyces cavernicola]|uniref:VOC family protein n=1 Tax=Streptomyces cavernicola TaxID=3043613 RepID=A0ABT6SEQ4_9ACTN|nr:VOC family protein [Streptomyces sp. B-S-A6]MDI3406648.1 VOC family protein [Streptomyces sp. B-S-A6]